MHPVINLISVATTWTFFDTYLWGVLVMTMVMKMKMKMIIMMMKFCNSCVCLRQKHFSSVAPTQPCFASTKVMMTKVIITVIIKVIITVITSRSEWRSISSKQWYELKLWTVMTTLLTKPVDYDIEMCGYLPSIKTKVTKDIHASLNIFAAAEIWNMFVCNQIWQRNSKHICVRTNLKCICWPRNLIYFQRESNVYMVNTDNKENYGTKWEKLHKRDEIATL